jgi:mRNA degradation ribonuclease J1/J2
MSEMDLKFYGGIDEIGGNRILVEDGSSRIFLDNGMSFTTCLVSTGVTFSD